MKSNHLEQVVAEWYEFTGYFVRRNVFVGPGKRGGYECELDLVAFHPIRGELIHVEPSMDCLSWPKREVRFKKKFDAGKKYIHKLYEGIKVPSEIKQVALLVYAGTGTHTRIGGGDILLARDFFATILEAIKEKELRNEAISEQFSNLRTIQYLTSLCL